MKRGPASQRSSHYQHEAIVGACSIDGTRTVGRRDDNRAATRLDVVQGKAVVGRTVIGDKRERIGG